jgi:hypothetical protein
MAKILVLAKSGFGKTTSWAGREKLGIKGLDPKNTFVIQCIGRAVPNKNFKLCNSTNIQDLKTGNRIAVDILPTEQRYAKVASIITALVKSPYKNIVLDDFSFLIQDYYMANSLRKGWDTAKEMGAGMQKIFQAIKLVPEDKNIFICAHYMEYKDKKGDSISYKFKSVGNMVDEYICPEGQADVILYGKQEFDNNSNKPVKQFVKEFDGEYPAKDSVGYLDSLDIYFPNDLSIVEEAIDKFYQG